MPDDSSILRSTAVTPLREFGDAGEAIAAQYLKRQGYRLVLTNFEVPIGRNRNEALITGEIDIIALDGDTLCFIEVKTRSSDDIAGPLAAIGLRKQRQIIRAARIYRRIFKVRDMAFRYDAVSVLRKPGERPVVELAKGYWNESSFRKKRWSDTF